MSSRALRDENGRTVFAILYDRTKWRRQGKEESAAQKMCFSLDTLLIYWLNGDPKMPIVAMEQEYFAEQTRRQEPVRSRATRWSYASKWEGSLVYFSLTVLGTRTNGRCEALVAFWESHLSFIWSTEI